MSRRVLFFAPFGAWRVHNQVDAVLAAALRQRGAEVMVVGCDGVYPVCDLLAWSGERAKQDCAACAAGGVEFFGKFGLVPSQLRAWLQPEDFAEAERFADAVPPEQYSVAEWNGLPLGRWVTSSVYTYFRITAAGLVQPQVRAVHRRFVVTGILTWQALTRIFDKFQPDHAVIFNARMAPFRVAFEFARSRGLRPLVHERGAFDDAFNLFENEDCLSTRPLKQAAAAWQDVPLTADECVAAKTYLAQREFGKGMNFPSFYGYQTEYATVRRALRIPEDAKILLLLTSSEFELVCSEHFQSLAGQMELLDQFIERFRHRPEYLVIRHHPHIGGLREAAPDYDFISRAYRQLARAPANVRVIMPAEAMTSYALFWNVDACVSFFSSAGLEGAARGLAAAAFAESHYQQGMTCAIEQTTPDYLDRLVSDLFDRTGNFGTADLRRIHRFVHAFMTRLPKRFKAFGIKNHFEEDLRFQSLEDLRPGNDPELDRVCDHLLRGAPLLSSPTEADKARDLAAEEPFFREELEEIRRQRAEVKSRSLRRTTWSVEPVAAILRFQLEAGGSVVDPGSQRHAHVRDYTCAIAPSAVTTAASELETVTAALAGVKETYVLVAHPSLTHDASLLSTALDQLVQDTDCALHGILCGVYLADPAGNISGEILTKRRPATSFDTLVQAAPCFGSPAMLLGLGVFRRERLLDLLRAALSSAAAEPLAAARALFDAFQSPAFRRLELPLVVASRSP